jgi:cellulose synthase/poly-beta-1,6-N-acetylglucosamine synthase-like glycosyltransferase
MYLAIVSLAGLPRKRPRSVDHRCSTRFAVLVPAHNEEIGIRETLDSFHALRYPAELFSVHVVADNCADQTARVVEESGWEVHERSDREHAGKGPALNWLLDRVLSRGDEVDAVVIVDADTTLDVDFLTEMDTALRAGASVAQGYYSVRDPDTSPATAFRFAALACRHHLRALGRTRLGGSCGLYGNGMVFKTGLLTTHRWSGHLVEDAELQNELLLAGHLVRYVPDAVVWAEMPTTTPGATSQNERWERGRVEIARRYLPALVRRTIAGPNRRAAGDAVLDHLVPPLSVLGALEVAAMILAAAARLASPKRFRWALVASMAAIMAVTGHVVAGLASVHAPRHYYTSLLREPKIILWKVLLWVRVVTPRSRVTWERTRRNAEEAV